MAINEQIQRLQTAKANLKTSIEAKGVTVPSAATLDAYSDYVDAISGGGANIEPSKTVTIKRPSSISGPITPSTGYDGMAEVVIALDPSRSTKTLRITENGNTTLNFTEESASHQNNYMGYGTVMINVDVPTSGGDYGALIDGSISALTASDFGNATQIKNYVFYGCSGLTSVTIPSGVTSIGDYAFQRCTSLASIDIPNSVTSIGVNTFQYCSALTSVVIPSGVTSIGNNTFQYCSALTSVVIPSGVTSIGGSVFVNCTSLASIELPSALTSIGGSAFSGCTSLASIDIPSGVTSIGNSAFQNCTSLSQITCEAVTPPTAQKNTFSGVTPDAVYVPAESVDAYKAAQYWSAFASVIQAIPAPSFNGILYTSTDGNIVNPTTAGWGASIISNTYESGVGKIEFSGDITIVPKSAFTRCTTLETITFPDSVTAATTSSIFSGCTALTTVNWGSGMRSIGGSNAFRNCSSLTSITIPSGTTNLGNYMFAGCSSLDGNIDIPTGITSFPSNIFSGCTSLDSITITKTNVIVSGIDNMFPETTFTIYVPSDLVNTYKTDTYWSEYANRIQAIPS